MNYFICGFMGAGKTTYLEECRAREDLEFGGYNFVDLDQYIMEKYCLEGESLGEFIQKSGMECFRELELHSIKSLFSGDKIFLALGGGAVNIETMPYLSAENIKGYWMTTSFDICWKRIREDRGRPLVNLGEEKLRELYQEREKFYCKFEPLSGLKI